MFKRFWNAIKRYQVCMGVNHDITHKNPICSRCGYNIAIPSQKQKNRRKSRGKRK